MITVLKHHSGVVRFPSRAALMAMSPKYSVFFCRKSCAYLHASDDASHSEQSSQLKIEAMVSPIAHAPPKDNRADKRLHQHRCVEVVGEM